MKKVFALAIMLALVALATPASARSHRSHFGGGHWGPYWGGWQRSGGYYTYGESGPAYVHAYINQFQASVHQGWRSNSCGCNNDHATPVVVSNIIVQHDEEAADEEAPKIAAPKPVAFAAPIQYQYQSITVVKAVTVNESSAQLADRFVWFCYAVGFFVFTVVLCSILVVCLIGMFR